MEIAVGKLPLFTKDVNCLIVKCKLEERYKNKGVAIRRLFGIWEMKVQFPAVRYSLWDVGQVISPLLPKFTIKIQQWLLLYSSIKNANILLKGTEISQKQSKKTQVPKM